MANKIANEPVFNWWVYTVLRKRKLIVAKVKCYWQTTHKFGIRLPKTVAEALAIDDQTGTDFWRKAFGKEMDKVKVAWTAANGVLPEKAQTGMESSMIGYQEIRCHVIFVVKWISPVRRGSLLAGTLPIPRVNHIIRVSCCATVCDWHSSLPD